MKNFKANCSPLTFFFEGLYFYFTKKKIYMKNIKANCSPYFFFFFFFFLRDFILQKKTLYEKLQS